MRLSLSLRSLPSLQREQNCKTQALNEPGRKTEEETGEGGEERRELVVSLLH